VRPSRDRQVLRVGRENLRRGRAAEDLEGRAGLSEEHEHPARSAPERRAGRAASGQRRSREGSA
jgi:hypothetical protein